MRIAQQSDSGRDFGVTSTFDEAEGDVGYEDEEGWATEGHMQGTNMADYEDDQEKVVHSTVRSGGAEASNGAHGPHGPSSAWPGPNDIPSPPGRSGSMRDPVAELEHLLALPGAMHPVVPPPETDGQSNGNGNGRNAASPRRRVNGLPPAKDMDSLPPLPRSDEIDSLDDPVAKLEYLLERPGAAHPTMPPPPYADEQLERIRQHDSATFSGRAGRAAFQRKESTDMVTCPAIPCRALLQTLCQTAIHNMHACTHTHVTRCLCPHSSGLYTS